MKALLTAAAFCLIAAPFARSESEPGAVKGPGETVDVTRESPVDLFERVREAHIRAEQKGAVSPAAKT